MKNISEILQKILKDVPDLKPFFTNLLSAEIKDKTIHVRFPSIFELKVSLIRLLDVYKIANKYNLDISFVDDFKEPFLPFTVLNSKYKNYIYYVMVDKKNFHSFIIQKNKLLSNNLQLDFLEHIKDIEKYTENQIKATIKDSLSCMYLRLKNSWTYLHPVVFHNEEAKSYQIDKIFYNITDDLVEEFDDIKRFVGEPFFTFYDLKKYIEKKIGELR